MSANLRAIVLHAIRWDPEERYGSVKAFASDLQRYLEGELPQIDSPETGHIDTTPSRVSIAVLPFRFLDNGNNENAFFAPGLADALVSRLSRVERLSIRPTSSTLKYANGSNTAKAANELKVKYILEGSLHVVDDCVRVGVQLVYCEASVAVWAAQFDEPADTNGQFALVEARLSPGAEPPVHVHKHEDELFYVLEGRLKVYCGDEELILEPGDSVVSSLLCKQASCYLSFWLTKPVVGSALPTEGRSDS